MSGDRVIYDTTADGLGAGEQVLQGVAVAAPEPQSNERAIAKAFNAAKSESWTEALKYAERADDPLTVRLIEWLRYQKVDPRLEFSPIADFTAANWSSADIALESYVFTMTIDSVIDAGAWTEGSWTGGSQGTVDQRQAVVRAFRPTIR